MEEGDPAARKRRTTPGRSAKVNKRKLSEEGSSRAVKQKVDPKAKMALALEQLQAEFSKSEARIQEKKRLSNEIS